MILQSPASNYKPLIADQRIVTIDTDVVIIIMLSRESLDLQWRVICLPEHFKIQNIFQYHWSHQPLWDTYGTPVFQRVNWNRYRLKAYTYEMILPICSIGKQSSQLELTVIRKFTCWNSSCFFIRLFSLQSSSSLWTSCLRIRQFLKLRDNDFQKLIPSEDAVAQTELFCKLASLRAKLMLM